MILGSLIPRLLREALGTLPSRPALAEAPETGVSGDAGKTRSTEALLFAEGAKLAKAMDEEARIRMDPDLDPGSRLAQLRQSEANQRERLAAIARIRKDAQPSLGTTLSDFAASLIPKVGAIPVLPKPSRIPVIWVDGSDSPLLPQPTERGAAAIVQEKQLDALIHGSLRRERDDIVITMRIQEKVSGTSMILYTGRSSASRPQEQIPALAARIEAWIAGGPYARMALQVTPPGAKLQSTGGDTIQGSGVYFFYEPASISLEASADGYAPRALQFSIQPGERRSETIRLERLATAQPEPTPGIGSALAAALDEGNSPAYLKTFTAAKDRFYRSLGGFAVSLPTALVSWGIHGLFAEAAERSGTAELRTGSTVMAVSTGVAAASVLYFAITSVLDLISYIGAAH
jgi:hypothetical protein